MQPPNAHFKHVEYWSNHNASTPEQVLDLSRCLEDIAFRCVPDWHWKQKDASIPTPKQLSETPQYDLIGGDPNLTSPEGWIAQYLPLPHIATMVSPDQWGSWHIEVCGGSYVFELYCNGRLIDDDLFMNCSLDLCEATGKNEAPWICIRIQTHRSSGINLGNVRVSLSGLNEYNNIVRDIARSLRTSCYLLSKENRRDNLYVSGEVNLNLSSITDSERKVLYESLYRAAGTIDMRAAQSGNPGKFIGSLKRCREALTPLATFAKQFTVYLIGHAHMDLAWKWRWPESVECMKGTLENQLDLMERDSDYVFVESSAVMWKALAEKYTDLWTRCREACDRGQLEPIGGMWCEPDVQCVAGESLVRQLLVGQDTARRYFGKESVCGFNIDAFGYNAALPKIYRGAGIDSFITQKLRYNEFTLFPYTHFWWESDDGSRILGLHIYPSHMHRIDPDDIPQIARIVHLSSGLKQIPIMFGYGNHGGGPLPDMMDRIEEMKTHTVFPHLQYSSFGDYVQRLHHQESSVLEKLPIVRDELFLETHHKTFSVQGKVKEANRECERQLLAVEALGAVGLYHGTDYPKTLMNSAWERTLFNQFHDILPGTSIPSVYQDVFDDYDAAQSNIAEARGQLAEKLLGTGNKVYVFNPLPWRRNAIVCLPGDLFHKSGTLKDSQGRHIEYQKTADEKEIVFIANDLPGLGFETFESSGKTINTPTSLCYGDNWAENSHFRVAFDKAEGVINSLTIDGLEIVDGSIGRLTFLEDGGSPDYKTWNLRLTGQEFKPQCTSFEQIEAGPVRVVFRAKYEFGLWEKKKPYFGEILWHTPGVEYPTSFFTQDFIIYADSNRIECVLEADWWEDDIILKVMAETSLKPSRALYSIPFGVIERPTKRTTPYEEARYEVPANGWAELSGPQAGLAILNRSRHGYSALENQLGLTLLTSPSAEDTTRSSVPDPLADRGRHRIEYAFYPHCGDYKASKLHRWSADYEHPAVVLYGNDKPNIPIGKDILRIDPDAMICTAVKPSENNRSIIVRVFEPYGQEAEIQFSGMLAENKIIPTDILERNTQPYGPLKLKPFGVQTLRIVP
ncbi:MAG: alpha-mannosidase [Lentisphaerae bacterium]|nr:alpha-mannosidase [Lentisphaerota bacterium]